MTGLQAQRRDAERDVLAFGLLMHYALAGQHALEQTDTAAAMALCRRTGAKSCTCHGPRHARFPRRCASLPTAPPIGRSASVTTAPARALEGWIQAEEAADGGALALLAERLRSNGALPSLPGAARRAARLALMERERTNELAEIVLQDPALTFELLRGVNAAEVRGAMIAGSGPVLTMRRAIALVGLDGVRRAALALRDWPGPLGSGGAAQLEQAIARAQRGARIAQLLRPPGYDAEVVYLVALLRCLGQLVTHYHFPEEPAQIDRLMQPVVVDEPGQADEPGMSEESASLAVLGVEIDALGAAVARHWGLDESLLHMIRRFGLRTAVRAIESDDEMLRATASCANEVVDALNLPARQSPAALQRVAQRYARALDLSLRDLQSAAQGQSSHDAPDDRDGPRSTWHPA